MNRSDLEERLIDFSVLIIKIIEELPKTRAASHFSGQLVRSATSCALNYGEAQAGESRKDFIHKLKIVHKELRETYVGLRILNKTGIFCQTIDLEKAIRETNELISIFTKSIVTAERKLLKS